MSDAQSVPPIDINAVALQVASLTKLVSEQKQQLDQLLGQDEEDHEGSIENDDNQSDVSFTEIVSGLNGQTEKSAASDELLEALADVEVETEFGDEIQEAVATAFTKTVTRPLTKETKEKLKKKLLIPNNCKNLITPKMNPEIWNLLPQKSRLTDLNLQQIQNALSTSVASFAVISNEISRLSVLLPKDSFSGLLKRCMDSANVLGSQIQDINMKRKLNAKPILNAEIAGICSLEIAPTELLFGNNLNEAIKTSKATSSLVRSSGISKNRFRPYPQRGNSGNGHRPFHHRGRWNGNAARGRHQPFRQYQPYQNQRFQQPNQPTFKKN